MAKEVLLGNEAIGYALAANGLGVAAAYPGTPSSEILPSVVRYNQAHDLGIHAEWSVNEKIALDQAFAAAITGLRSACAMKQVGLNVAADSLMSAVYMGVKGGMIVVSADDPGPHSSQTEQDSRMMAFVAKAPVLDPATPDEAMKMVAEAFKLSERFEIPFMLRTGIRVCHAKQAVTVPKPKPRPRQAIFERDPGRWAATPKFRYILHQQLNAKLAKLAAYNNRSPFNKLSFDLRQGKPYPLGVIASGAPAAALADLLADLGQDKAIPVLRLGAPYPFPDKLVGGFVDRCKKVLVVGETDQFVELLAPGREKLLGRITGHVPGEGELTPEVIDVSLRQAMKTAGLKAPRRTGVKGYDKVLAELKLPIKKPRLCPGCGHRAAFWSIRKAFPKAIFTSDIGCYTLGLNLRAVDTVLDMGSGITMAAGLYHALAVDGKEPPPVMATMGDSTFFHSGTSSLISAIYNKAKFVLVLLDNGTTAMTGMQPTPDLGITADGGPGGRVPLERLITGCGVDHLTVVDAYDIPNLIEAIKAARAEAEKSGVTCVIARHPCRIAQPDQAKVAIRITDKCDGCGICVATFECPAMSVPKKGRPVEIDPKLCVHCGVCVHVCPKGGLEVV